MDVFFVVPFLALVSLLGVCVFAIVDQRRTEARKNDPQAPKSALAADGPA